MSADLQRVRLPRPRRRDSEPRAPGAREAVGAFERLGSSRARLRDYSLHLQRVREEERKRLARDIHDSLGSALVALKLELGGLRARLPDGDLAARAAAMARLIDTALADLDRLVTDLRPSILDHQGLWAAMEWHMGEFLRASGLHGRLEWHIAPHAPAPDDAFATAAFRIFQEMLNNVARHARATEVRATIAADAHRLALEVRDNGRGATLAELRRPDCYGVLGMSERARALGGRLEIGPARGGGTRVRVWLPFARSGDA